MVANNINCTLLVIFVSFNDQNIDELLQLDYITLVKMMPTAQS